MASGFGDTDGKVRLPRAERVVERQHSVGGSPLGPQLPAMFPITDGSWALDQLLV